MELLTMTMPAQPANGSHGQTAHVPTAPAAASDSKGAFVRMLAQMTDAGEDRADFTGPIGLAASFMPSGQIPQPLLEALFGRAGEEVSLADAIGRLLHALQDESELKSQFLAQPEMAAWLAETAALLKADDSGQTAGHDAGPESAGQPDPRVILAQLLNRMIFGGADETAAKQGVKLLAAVQNLAETEPALAQLFRMAGLKTQPESAEPVAKPEVQVAQGSANPGADVPVRTAGLTEQPVLVIDKSRAETANHQLLARLAHMNQPVHVLAGTAFSHESGVANGTPASADTAPGTALNPGLAEAGMQPPVMPPATAPVSHNPAAAQTAPADRPPMMHAGQFAEQMGEWMVKQFSVIRAGALSQARITLVPEHLGQLDVKISVQNGTVTAVFAAETAGAREMLELQLPQLRMALQQQGFQVERLVVSQQATGPGSGQFQDERQRQPWEREERRQNPKESLNDEELFELLSGIDASYGDENPLRYGSTFHATA